MSTSFKNKLSLILLLIPYLALALVYNKLPQQVALHFNINGQPDRFGAKSELWWSCGILVVVGIAILFLLTNIHKVERNKNKLKNQNVMATTALFVSLLFCGVQFAIITSAYNPNLNHFGFRLILALVGVLYAVIGNYMPTLKPNHFVGIRVPWTLNSENNWRQTHQKIGKYWFASGVFLFLVSWWLPFLTLIITLLVITLALAIYSISVSYTINKNENKL
jgi:uncharacterized membrane protein